MPNIEIIGFPSPEALGVLDRMVSLLKEKILEEKIREIVITIVQSQAFDCQKGRSSYLRVLYSEEDTMPFVLSLMELLREEFNLDVESIKVVFMPKLR